MEEIKFLYENQFYSSVKMLSSMMIDGGGLKQEDEYLLHVYYADCFYKEGLYRRAETEYKKALKVKKVVNKARKTGDETASGGGGGASLPSEIDVKYKLHECYYHLKQFKDAISMLETVPAKQRDLRVCGGLARLYQRLGMDRPATTHYKEVLKKCPLALDAAQALLSLGVKGVEVASLSVGNLPPGSHRDWLSIWIKAKAHMVAKDYSKAITTFKSLDSKGMLEGNHQVLCSLADCWLLVGNTSAAFLTYQRAYKLDPLNPHGMDFFSFLIFQARKTKELENLAVELMSITDGKPEPWVAMGYYSALTNKATKALYFAQKAFQLDSRCVPALLLKGVILSDMGKLQEAILHYREATRLAPHRIQTHQGLVDCYLKNSRLKDALNVASNAVKTLGSNPLTLTLYASTLAKDPSSGSIDRAKSMLQKALEDFPNLPFCEEAAYAMGEILREQKQYSQAIHMLCQALSRVTSGSSGLHLALADFYALNNEPQEAMDHYNKALSLDPLCDKAIEGLNRIENSMVEMDTEMSDTETIPPNEGPEQAWADGWLS